MLTARVHDGAPPLPEAGDRAAESSAHAPGPAHAHAPLGGHVDGDGRGAVGQVVRHVLLGETAVRYGTVADVAEKAGLFYYPTNIGIARGTPSVATLVVVRNRGRNLGCYKGFHITNMALGTPGQVLK